MFTLTCTVRVNENVDTSVDVTGEWSKGGMALVVDNSGCISISEATTMDRFTHETSLIFTPLRSSIDAGEYNCSATVSSAPQVYIRPNSNSNTFQLVINGMSIFIPTYRYHCLPFHALFLSVINGYLTIRIHIIVCTCYTFQTFLLQQ